MEKSVGVVIVTYNRRNLLEITLCKVMSQTYRNFEILVVNNNSKDGTKDFLAGLNNITIINLPDNMGPAGGFYEGTKHFAEVNKKDLVWLMDDDFFPMGSCLEELVKKSRNDIVLFPYVRDKAFKSVKKPAWWGVLIPGEIIHHVGYPMKELFFWSEDTEYLQARIQQKFNYECAWVPEAKGVHFTKRQTNYRQAWRHYYEVRNMLYSRLYVKKTTPLRVYKIGRSWFKLGLSILLLENDKAKKLSWFFRGTVHGIQKKLGKTIDPDG